MKKVMHVSLGECCFVSILAGLCQFGFFLLLFFSDSFMGFFPDNDQIDALIVLFCFPLPCFDTWDRTLNFSTVSFVELRCIFPLMLLR